MHTAPAVSLMVARSRWQLITIGVLLAVGALSVGHYAVTQAQAQLQVLGMFCTLLLAAGMSLLQWKRFSGGCLTWDGLHWQWAGLREGVVWHLTPVLNSPFSVLVFVRVGAGKKTWLWIDRCTDATQWRAFRRAMVFASHDIAVQDVDAVVGAPGRLA